MAETKDHDFYLKIPAGLWELLEKHKNARGFKSIKATVTEWLWRLEELYNDN